MLNLIAQKLGALVPTTWVARMQLRGEMVKLFREYYDGDHRMKLTSEMRKLLSVTDDRLDRYNANYCEMVVNAMADRLTVDTIRVTSESGNGALELAAFLQERLPGGENAQALARDLIDRFGMADASDDPAQGWVDGLLEQNRFDGLQIEVREAMLRDGDTYLMAQYDEAAQNVRLVHEPAWDGETGVMVVYDRQGKNVVAGAKVWWEGAEKRVNIYYGDRMAKYLYDDGMPVNENDERREPSLQVRGDEEFTDTRRGNNVVGVPIIHFANKGGPEGRSELVNVIPLQDSLNSTLGSMVASALLTAFPVMFSNFVMDLSKGLSPGIIFTEGIDDWISEDNAEKLNAWASILSAFKLERVPPGEINPLIEQADWLIDQISMITATPIPTQMGGDAQSGEALKQRDTRLLGKVQRAQVQSGNRWEDTIRLARDLYVVYGAKSLPAFERVNSRWKGAEMRNDGEIRETAKFVNELGFEREALRILSQGSIVEYTDDDIDRLMREKQQDAATAIQGLGAQLPELDAAGSSVGAPVAVAV